MMKRAYQEEGLRKLIFSSQIPESVDAGMTLIEDPVRLVKSAAPIFKLADENLRPPKGYVGIHTIALGDWETYGMNRNGDTFPKRACVDRCQTFVTHGHVFRNHDNRDPEKAIGKIAAAAYNEPMGRIELIIWADEKKAAPELHKLATEGDHPFSMACVSANTCIVTTYGIKKIIDIVPGDMVLTHTGKWQKVGNRSVRTVDAYLRVRLVSWGRTDLEITANHEVLAVRFEDIPSPRPVGPAGRRLPQARRANRGRLHKYARWVPAGELTPLHYMLVPIDRTETHDVDVAWARLLGYYIAEGSLAAGTLNFTCHADDAAVRELPDLADWTSTTITPKANSDAAVTVACFGVELMRRVDAECGHPGPNKRVPMSIQHADAEAKLNFMAAWFNGDGWQDERGMHWSTHYQALAIDLQRLLASCDMPSSCMRIDHPEDRGLVKSDDAVEYVVSVSNEFSDMFCDISKAGQLDICGSTKCRTFISGDYLCVPVHSVDVVKETTEVFNFSVEGDESYTAYGLAVHNCKVPNDRCTVCDNIRKSAADPRQCEHVRDNLGHVLKNGTAVGTHNDFPTWFDESFVRRPADRIAWSLGKVASADDGMGGLDSVKLAEASGLWIPDALEYSIPGYQSKLTILQKLAALEEQYLGLAATAQRNTHRDLYLWELRKAADYTLPDAVVDELRRHDPDRVFRTLVHSGVIMDAPTFFKYAMGLDYGELAPDMGHILARTRNSLFGRLHKSGAYQRVCRNAYFDVDTDPLTAYGVGHDNELARLGRTKLASAGAFVGQDVDSRIIDATLQGRQVGEVLTLNKLAAEDNPAADRAAEIYAAYKVSMVNNIVSYHKRANADSLLALAAVQDLVR